MYASPLPWRAAQADRMHYLPVSFHTLVSQGKPIFLDTEKKSTGELTPKPSLLEGVGFYTDACAATMFVHLHTTSFR
jgi:hypothetical protein